MLKALIIKNYALIDQIDVELSGGLVILTGETGAGKSILIDALGLILGQRASGEAVRAGADKAIVEATFAVTGNRRLQGLFLENDLDWVDELLVRREVSSRGQSRCFVNDTPVTITLLKQIGELLVDLHGQHEHQSLLRPESHGLLIDEFGGLEALVAEYQTAFQSLRALREERDGLRAREQALREKREFYTFQMQEIDAVGPLAGEEEALEEDLRILENAEMLYAATTRLHEILYEGDHSVHDLLVVARNQLQDLAAIDRQFTEAAAECASAEAVVGELARFLQRYNSRVEFNPARLEDIRQRLGKLALLKKKYGGTIDAVLSHRKTIGQDAAIAENFDEVIARLNRQIEESRDGCAALAGRLSAKRHETSRKVDAAVVQELAKLGIGRARFSTRITRRLLQGPATDDGEGVMLGQERVQLHGRGYDNVEFFLSTNLGEDERPLVRVASGGEVSRVMLALKSILAKSDRLPVLIFDEIDVGVSGRIAQAVGMSLKALSGFHQVIAITHLPQIAGLADTHFAVEKTERHGRTASSLRLLTLEEQVREVAKLMSGAEVTEAGLAGARELMGLAPRRRTS